MRGCAAPRRSTWRSQQILERYHVARYLKVTRVVREEHTFKQAHRGRPGPDTDYREDHQAALRHRVDASTRPPSPTTRRATACTPHDQRPQPHRRPRCSRPTRASRRIEKRFEQIKTVHEIAPVFLKNEGRIEALFTLYFLALLVQALIERELRLAMQRAESTSCRSTPKQRLSRDPTTEQILRLFSLAERHTLFATTKPFSPSHPSSPTFSYKPSICSGSRSKPSSADRVAEIHVKSCPRCAECKARQHHIGIKNGSNRHPWFAVRDVPLARLSLPH